MSSQLDLLVSSAAFASFAWALRGHFDRGPMPLGMLALSLASLASFTTFATLLLASTPSAAHLVEAATLFGLSFALFWWTVRTTRRRRLSLAHSHADPAFLHVTGPYAFIRHPFYAAYLLFWFGTAIAAGALQWLPVAILTAWYVVLARREEARLGAGALGDSYRQYRSGTGMLFPRLVARAVPRLGNAPPTPSSRPA